MQKVTEQFKEKPIVTHFLRLDNQPPPSMAWPNPPRSPAVIKLVQRDWIRK
jgi:hypothetical protein